MADIKHRIGIMGGTFNPVHNGHLMLARQSYFEYKLDKVIFMPAGRPPHKQDMQILNDTDRLNMLQAAVGNTPYFEISAYEIQKNGLSYTFETLEYLHKVFEDAMLYFIMGADSVNSIETWVRPDRILRLAHILAAVRDDTDLCALDRQARYLRQKYGGRISLLSLPQMNISSHEIRNLAKSGASIAHLVPQTVAAYIQNHGLYQSVPASGNT